MKQWFYLSLVVSSLLYAESVDEALEGFDESPQSVQTVKDQSETNEALSGFDEGDDATDTDRTAKRETDDMMAGFDESVPDNDEENLSVKREDAASWTDAFSGELKQQVAYALSSRMKNREDFSSLRSTFFLDYDQKFENGIRLKVNARAFYDWVYHLDNGYTSQEEDSLQSEVELFDAYIEGSISEHLDYRIGRQVVVWGRSDTIRITDVLNPLDNRQPGMVDIEDLRLPVAMAKFDWYVGTWRVTPIAILEQRFTKDPPYGSPFYPAAIPLPPEKSYNDVTYALSLGTERSGWDINFYAAHIYDDTKFVQDPFGLNALVKHGKINMYGTAFNILSGSWLFKSEWAYFDKLHYTMAPDTSLARLDGLVGVEYNGIADTMISYDLSLRHFTHYDKRLGLDHIDLPNGTSAELLPVKRDTWQHAFRITSDFMNATLHANYLVTLFGKRGNEGGFQRLWAVYDYDDNLKIDVGILDFVGGSKLFEGFAKERILFTDIVFSF